MLKKLVSILLTVLMLSAVFSIPLEVFAADPTVTFSHEAGFYTQAFNLTLSAEDGAVIYYTIDGTEPTTSSSVYRAPFAVNVRSDYPIQTGVSQRSGGYGGNRVTLIGNHVVTYPVVKARAYKDGEWTTKTITKTYLIDKNINTLYGNMPVLSLTVEPKDFSDRTTGMYTNYANEDLVAQSYNQYFEGDGSLAWEHSAELKVVGHGSRGDNKKKLRLNFNKGTYEDKKSVLKYSLIENSTKNYYDRSSVTSYCKLNIRTSDWSNTDVKESLAQKIADVTHADTAASEPVTLLINGEFWGVYDFREQYDARYIAEHYGINKDNVVQINFDWDTYNTKYSSSNPLYRAEYSEGPSGEEETYFNNWNDLWTLITGTTNGKTIADDENYAKLEKMADMDSFVDYYLVYLFGDNADAPSNNLKVWRTTATFDPEYDYLANGKFGDDGRWRFFIHDFDISFDSTDLGSWYGVNNRLEGYTTAVSTTDARRGAWATNMFKSLLTNAKFRQKISAHLNTYASTAFAPARTQAILDDLQAKMTTAKAYDMTRWNLGSLSKWQSSMATLRNYLSSRPTNLQGYFVSYFNKNNGYSIPTTYSKFNFKTDGSKGYLGVDGADTRACDYGVEKASNWTANYFKTMPMTIIATPLEGYELESITVEHNGTTQTYKTDSVTLTPANDSAAYTVTANFKSATGVTLETAELAKAIENAKALDASVYTSESYAVLSAKLSAAEKALSSAVTQAAIDSAAAELNSAINALTVKIITTALEAAIDKAEAIDPDDYTSSSFAVLNTAYLNGQSVLLSYTTQKQVDDAAAAIENAISKLVRKIDTSDLEKAIAEGEAIEPYIYSASSFAALTAAIENGRAVVDNSESAAQVAQAASAIRSAIKNLVVAIDITKLKQYYEEIDEMDTSVYDPVTTRVLEDVMARVANIVERPESQQEVDNALAELKAAVAALKPRISTIALGETIESAKKINAASYTADSAAAFKKALENAEQVYALPESQQAVDEANTQLSNAMAALVEKPASAINVVSVNGYEGSTGYANASVNFDLVITTPTDVTGIALYNENGAGLGRTMSYVDNGNVRTWTVTASIGSKGARTITIGTKTADTAYEATEETVQVNVLATTAVLPETEPSVPTEPSEPKVLTMGYPAQAARNELFTVKVNTTDTVSKIGVFNDNGAGITKYNLTSVRKGSTIEWTFSIKASTKGLRTFTIKPADSEGVWQDGKSFTMIITK